MNKTQKIIIGGGLVALAGWQVHRLVTGAEPSVPPPNGEPPPNGGPPPDGYGSIQLRGDDWNMVVYPGETGDIVSLMESIAGYGLLVYYYAGEGEWLVYWPEFEINTIGQLVHDQVYQIHVDQDVVWHVPLPQ